MLLLHGQGPMRTTLLLLHPLVDRPDGLGYDGGFVGIRPLCPYGGSPLSPNRSLKQLQPSSQCEGRGLWWIQEIHNA